MIINNTAVICFHVGHVIIVRMAVEQLDLRLQSFALADPDPARTMQAVLARDSSKRFNSKRIKRAAPKQAGRFPPGRGVASGYCNESGGAPKVICIK